MNRVKSGGLLALLFAVGAIGGLVVYVPRPDVTVADLQDAGLGECQSVGMDCPVLKTTWPDGGNGRTRMLLEGHLCDGDGGKYLVHVQYWDTEVTNWSECRLLPDVDGGWPRELPR